MFSVQPWAQPHAWPLRGAGLEAAFLSLCKQPMQSVCWASACSSEQGQTCPGPLVLGGDGRSPRGALPYRMQNDMKQPPSLRRK